MWPNSEETQELIVQAARGDAAASNQLLERHRQALVRMIACRMDPMLKRRLDASDIVQEVLADANRRLDDYLADPKLPFHLWLRHMARDRIIDAHRRHRGAARRSIDRERPLAQGAAADESAIDLAAMLTDRELTPAAQAMRRELEERFRAALDDLDETDREVILMRHYEQLSNQEVAEALGLTQAASGMRYLRALRRLRTIVNDISSPDQPS